MGFCTWPLFNGWLFFQRYGNYFLTFALILQIHLAPREGVIIEWPPNGQFHDCGDVILTSWMAVSNIFLRMAVIVKSRYYDNQKSRNVRITENRDLEITVSENHDWKS